MKDIILAAGYATRLYPLTKNFPKPLLEVGGQTILDRLISDLDAIGDIDEHIVVSNGRFFGAFERWAADARKRCRKPLVLLDDGSRDNEHRAGAVKDLLLALERCAVDDDVLVAAADNLLDFSLESFVEEFRKKGTSLIMCHREESLQALQKTGVVTLDDRMRVLLMEEKPQRPQSHWAVPPFYIYRRHDLPLIRRALAEGCACDAPGNLARWLSARTTLHAFPIPGSRFDIGDLAALETAKQRFNEVQRNRNHEA